MDKFNIEAQYQLYLKRMDLSEDTMHPQQKIQLRHTFYGATGQMLLFLRDDIAELSEDKGAEVLQDILDQVGAFFLQESTSHQSVN